MKAFVVLFIICIFPIFASVRPNELVIQSSHAQYNGSEISLDGEVVVDHDLGRICADHVVLIRNLDKRKVHFPKLHMQDHVSINFNDGAQLCCGHADLDYNEKAGRFSGTPDQEYVVYSSICHEKEGAGAPFAVRSRKMKVNLSQKECAGCFITDIMAENDVMVDYQHHFKAVGDAAVYHRLNSTESVCKHKLEGVIHLKSSDQKQCCITTVNGDTVNANEIHIDTEARNLAFIYPKGVLHIAQGTSNLLREVAVSSDTMTWDEKSNLLTLREHVSVKQDDFGSLTNNDEVKIYQKKGEGFHQFQKIIADGKSVFVYTDKKSQMDHTLTTFGRIVVDHLAFKADIDSPKTPQGKVKEGEQVHFKDSLGTIFADHATVLYNLEDHVACPKKLILEGHVHLCNQFSSAEADAPFMQYAIADVAEYTMDNQEMTLSSKDNHRVLFYDKINNIQVSAPALKVKRNPQTKKESIQGSGDVRFTFMEQELDQIKRRFNLE